MIGILVELALSWLVLRLAAGPGLAALGWWPGKRRVVELVAGLLVAGLVCAVYHATMYLAGNGWTLNPACTAATLARSGFWVLKSALYETLIFQGALLYLAMQRLGTAKACLLSAACFGVYHWFSYGAFGNPVQMAFIFFMTAITGLMYAQAFAQTGSLYLPLGLHFGWNLVHIVVFSAGPLGPQLLVPVNDHKLPDLLSLVVFLFQVLALPVIAYLYLKRRSHSLAS